MANKKIIVWALFDSGNGCYTQAAQPFPNIEIYPIGIDIERKNRHFLPLNLADFGRLFGDNTLFNQLDSLPKPDVILASPPCESFSVANSIKGGNVCWQWQGNTRFAIRRRKDFEAAAVKKRRYRYETSFLNRINGELCIYNTIEIIKRYQPKIYVIENPYASRLWHYLDEILAFPIPYANPTYYGNYGWLCKKATKFKSNIPLNLRYQHYISGKTMFDCLHSYNARSAIPLPLIHDIYRRIIEVLGGNDASF
ncbi:class I SAM-dependent methyltransferase [Avibacterium paragallinarum]|uniref:DNA methyltransferase n=1 Tax=Avibacterium paragallinarum TaxID=728 RepID=UPI003989F0DC